MKFEDDKIANHKNYFEIVMLLETYVVDNEVCKNRYPINLSALEINSKVENFETIGIQYGDELDIYCTEERRKELNIEEVIEKYAAKEKDKIRIHTEKSFFQI